MVTFCAKCRKNTENLNSNISKTSKQKKKRISMESKSVVCGIKKPSKNIIEKFRPKNTIN